MSLMKLMATLGLDKSGYEKGLGEARTDAENAGSAIGKGLGTAAQIGGKALLASVGAVATGVSVLTKQAVSGYAEYEQLAGGIETLFGGSAQKMMQYSEEAFKAAGMSANQYMETSIQSAAAMINSLEGDTSKAADLMNMSIIDMSDNVNKMGTTMEAVQNAYRGFSRGNFTMLDNLALGFSGTKEGMEELLEKAKEVSGIEYDISSYSDIVQAIHVVQEEMGITGTTQKEAGDTITGSLSSVKAAWDNLVTGLADPTAGIDSRITNLIDTFTAFAGNMIPRISTAIQGVGNLLEKLIPQIASKLPSLIEEVAPTLINAVMSIMESLTSNAPQMVDVVFGIVENILTDLSGRLPDMLTQFINTVMSIVTSIVNNAPTLLESLVNVVITTMNTLITVGIPALTTLLTEELPTLLDGILNVITTLTDYILSDGLPLFLEMLPDLITGIVDFILSASTSITEAFVKIFASVVTALPDIIEAVVSILPSVITGIITALMKNGPALGKAINELTLASLVVIPEVITIITARLPQIIEAIALGVVKQAPKLVDAGKEAFNEMINNGMFGSESFDSMQDGVVQLMYDAVEAIKSKIADFKNVGKMIIDGLISGITSKVSSVKESIGGIAGTIKKVFTGDLDIHSPSGVFEDYGEYTDEGYAQGVVKNLGVVNRAMDSLNDSILTYSGMGASANTSANTDYDYDILTSALIAALREVAPEFATNVHVEGNRDRIVDITVEANRDYQRMTGASLYGI